MKSNDCPFWTGVANVGMFCGYSKSKKCSDCDLTQAEVLFIKNRLSSKKEKRHLILAEVTSESENGVSYQITDPLFGMKAIGFSFFKYEDVEKYKPFSTY